MIEERRFFLRVSLYTGGAAGVYWLVSGEKAGTVLLVAVTAGCLFLITTLGSASSGGPRPGDRGLRNVLGFDEPEEMEGHALEVEEAPVPGASPWPLILSLGLTLTGLGLLYGLWLLLPGLVVSAWGGLGWMTQLDPRGHPDRP